MIDYINIRNEFAKGLQEHLGIQIIRSNQTAPAPKHPYGTYNVVTIAAANNGTWQQHEDGKDRKLVRSVWSVTILAEDWDESVTLTLKAREWVEHTGRSWLAERGLVVQSVTDITNRDNILSVEYERKNGFDVVFYVYDEVESLTNTSGFIESVDIPQITTK